MAYLKPPFFVRRIFNPLAMRFGLGGAVTLAVRRRKSGALQQLPITPVDVGGRRYLVCPRGETDWVKNVRAAGELTLTSRGRSDSYSAEELAVDERPPVIDAYRKQLGRAVESMFRKLPDPADHPVFVLTPR